METQSGGNHHKTAQSPTPYTQNDLRQYAISRPKVAGVIRSRPGKPVLTSAHSTKTLSWKNAVFRVRNTCIL